MLGQGIIPHLLEGRSFRSKVFIIFCLAGCNKSAAVHFRVCLYQSRGIDASSWHHRQQFDIVGRDSLSTEALHKPCEGLRNLQTDGKFISTYDNKIYLSYFSAPFIRPFSGH